MSVTLKWKGKLGIDIPMATHLAVKLSWSTWTATLAVNLALAAMLFSAEEIGYDKGFIDSRTDRGYYACYRDVWLYDSSGRE